jgi:Pyridoxamine 5'-phosphate oxidase
MRDLLDALPAAVLAVYRANGTAYMSPVWHRPTDGFVEIVVAENDPKATSLRTDPRCVFMAFETVPPFRGLRIEASAQLSSAHVGDSRLAIASRYLGEAHGRRYVQERTKPGLIVRLPLARARTSSGTCGRSSRRNRGRRFGRHVPTWHQWAPSRKALNEKSQR